MEWTIREFDRVCTTLGQGLNKGTARSKMVRNVNFRYQSSRNSTAGLERPENLVSISKKLSKKADNTRSKPMPMCSNQFAIRHVIGPWRVCAPPFSLFLHFLPRFSEGVGWGGGGHDLSFPTRPQLPTQPPLSG